MKLIRTLFVLLFASTLLLGGCLSKSDPISQQHILELRESHLRFIDQFTRTSEKTWNVEVLDSQINGNNQKFEAALQYETQKSKPDALRKKAFLLLQEQFQNDAAFLKNQASTGIYFYSQVFAKNLKDQVQRNYDMALQGEGARVTP